MFTTQQRVRIYGAFNSSNNFFFKNNIHHDKCFVPLWSRCYRCGGPEDQTICSNTYNSPSYLNTENKRIINTVRVPSSEYTMNFASANSSINILENIDNPKPLYNNVPSQKINDRYLLQWNQSSDRAFPSRYKIPINNNVPSHGNSTKTSLTRHRPGSGAPPGIGVDLKHNSYQRFLLKKKGLTSLRGSNKPAEYWKPEFSQNSSNLNNKNGRIQNNKFRNDTIISNMYCPNCELVLPDCPKKI